VLILTKTGKHRRGKIATCQGKNKPAFPNSISACIHLLDQLPLTQPDGQTREPAFVIHANKGQVRPDEYFAMTGSPLGCFNTGVQHQHFLPSGWALPLAWLREELVTPQVRPSLGSPYPYQANYFMVMTGIVNIIVVYRYFTATIWDISKYLQLHSRGEFPFTGWS